jgi:hypothetical protein
MKNRSLYMESLTFGLFHQIFASRSVVIEGEHLKAKYAEGGFTFALTPEGFAWLDVDKCGEIKPYFLRASLFYSTLPGGGANFSSIPGLALNWQKKRARPPAQRESQVLENIR